MYQRGNQHIKKVFTIIIIKDSGENVTLSIK